MKTIRCLISESLLWTALVFYPKAERVELAKALYPFLKRRMQDARDAIEPESRGRFPGYIMRKAQAERERANSNAAK